MELGSKTDWKVMFGPHWIWQKSELFMVWGMAVYIVYIGCHPLLEDDKACELGKSARRECYGVPASQNTRNVLLHLRTYSCIFCFSFCYLACSLMST